MSWKHRTINNLDKVYQSAYCSNHCVETAVLCVQDNILQEMDRWECVFLLLLDLSCAFDTPDHSIKETRLSNRLGIVDVSLKLNINNLGDWKQAVVIGKSQSTERDLSYGVPQGSVLGQNCSKINWLPKVSLCENAG